MHPHIQRIPTLDIISHSVEQQLVEVTGIFPKMLPKNTIEHG
jgi:hypothetical protein